MANIIYCLKHDLITEKSISYEMRISVFTASITSPV